MYFVLLCYFIYLSSNFTFEEKFNMFAAHNGIWKTCEQIARNVRTLCVQEYPLKNTRINVQCAKLAVQVNTQRVSKHFIASVDGRGTELRHCQKSMDPVNLFRKSLFVLMHKRCILAFQVK